MLWFDDVVSFVKAIFLLSLWFDYSCIIDDNSKSEEIQLLKNSVVNDCEYIQNAYQKNYFTWFVHWNLIKIVGLHYYELIGKINGLKGKK